MRVAAVDVGTNTVRLLVAEDGRAVERDTRITRLGEAVDATGELAEAPMTRTVEAIAEFVGRARGNGARHVRIAGTSALRDARNRSDFTRRVLDECGEPLEILTGAEEGRLAYAGATTWLGDGSYVVCDIGGGSTELITRNDVISADVGSVRVRERYLPGNPPAPDAVETARSAVFEILSGFDAVKRIRGRLIGVAGTTTTIAALDAGLTVYDPEVVHGYTLAAEAVSRWAETLNELTVDEICGLGPVAPGRADVIGGGALILSCVVELLGRAPVTVSERDVLDGLVADIVR